MTTQFPTSRKLKIKLGGKVVKSTGERLSHTSFAKSWRLPQLLPYVLPDTEQYTWWGCIMTCTLKDCTHT